MQKFIHVLFTVICTIYSYGQTWEEMYKKAVDYEQKTNYKKSAELGIKALELYLSQSIEKDKKYSDILILIYHSLYETNDYASALAYCIKDSIWYVEKKLQNTADFFDCCNYLSSMYYYTGNIEIAENVCKKAMEQYTSFFIVKDTVYAKICDELAELYYKTARYSEAELLCRESLTIKKKFISEQSASCMNTYSIMGNIYRQRADYSTAYQFLSKVMNFNMKTMGEKTIDHAIDCSNLAGVLKQIGRIDEAEKLYLKSGKIISELDGNQSLNYASIINNIGMFYIDIKNYPKADSFLQISKTIYQSTTGKNSTGYASICHNLAINYQRMGRYKEALEHIKISLSIRERTYGKNSIHYASSLLIKMFILSKQRNYTEIKGIIEEISSILHYIVDYNFKNLSEAEKEIYYKSVIDKFNRYFEKYFVMRYKDEPSLSVRMFESVIEYKGLLLNNAQKVRQRIIGGKDTTLKKLYNEWKNSKQEFAQISMSKRKSAPKLDSLKKHIQELEKELCIKSQLFAETFKPKRITWNDIKNKIFEDEAVVEILKIEKKGDNLYGFNAKQDIYAAFIIKKGIEYPDVVFFTNGEDMDTQYLTNYRRSIVNKLEDTESYAVFWKPIRDKLQGIKRIYFSPDGVYHQINIQTLYNPDTQKYVLDETEIIYITNAKDILKPHITAHLLQKSYFIGNPLFNSNEQDTGYKGEFRSLSRLPGAEEEVKNIAQNIPYSVLKIGKEATEDYVKSIKNPRILHIATHGYFKKEEYQSSTQAMLNAGLLFAGVADYEKMEIPPMSKEDGKLTAFEIMNMELDSTELVVLSACETGLGKISREGVYGLQRAFKIAGAEMIVMSLWKVNDFTTQLLMNKFYEKWSQKKMNIRAAFEESQKELRNEYKEPYYWGAFIIID